MGFILENGLAQPVAPQAFAETAPLFFNGYFVPHQGLQLENLFQTYAQLYLGQPWVATVVNSIAKSMAFEPTFSASCSASCKSTPGTPRGPISSSGSTCRS